MEWKRLAVGPIQENTYILWNDKKEAVIFDPGAEGKKINARIEELGVKPLAILLTHAHFDHIGAVDAVRAKWNIPVYVHEFESDWLEDTNKNGSAHFSQNITAKPAEHMVAKGPLVIGDFTFDVLETPGHSPGSVSYYLKEANAVFSGDALFAGGIGRTDLYGGNQALLMKSIHDQLLTLPEETAVLSGHGFETTVGTEMDENPFLNGF
ncbi:hypothetical protein A374_15197 [Fictibacillus macauensis ZFHKF-1]|uniref:Metallo-beta-lactamase domain-containing protein n=1 Tax=Fictibacillus macauensis ZFHKF-1 TaxID=1196324 RepID=I8UCI6_9BACL|nr:MBL fold metallo-hydrolase [Fictibacillus macauensis]EIT84483.1 hypothetical protein A374_15197 [Fictibacillus macauensis ZFHKF-1]